MKKKMIMKKFTSISLAAMMALTAYMPAAVFAGEETDETTAPAEEPKAAASVQTETSQPSAAPASSAPTSSAPASSAPAASQATPEQSTEGQDVQAEAEEQPAAETSSYGEATENWGYGNWNEETKTGTTKWQEYTKDGETILVFSSTGESDLDEDNAVTQILDQNGNSVKNSLKNKVTQVVFETGITGIGWTSLYTKTGFEPLYNSDVYSVDQSKTDLFKDFTKLTTVVPCETIKRIGWSAFRKCYNLSNFDFTKCPQLEEIMNQAFNECKSLNNIDLSECNLLETIAWSAFNGAGKGNDANLALPKSGVLSIIGGYAFYQYARNNSNGAEVDFSRVANSVTQVMQNAFNSANVIGEISGFKGLEGLGKDAIKGSKITYIPYVAPVDEDTDDPGEEPSAPAEEPAAPAEEPAVPEDEPLVDEEDSDSVVEEAKSSDNDPVEENGVPAEAKAAFSAAEAMVHASSANSIPKATTGNTAGRSAVTTAALTSIGNSAAPATAPVSDTVTIGEASTPMADSQTESSLGYILGGMAAALLLALAAMKAVERRREDSNQ